MLLLFVLIRLKFQILAPMSIPSFLPYQVWICSLNNARDLSLQRFDQCLKLCQLPSSSLIGFDCSLAI